MTDQINVLSISDIKNLIEENNAALRGAIQILEILSNQTLQQPPECPECPKCPQISPLPQRNYPGYTTPPKYGFMTQY